MPETEAQIAQAPNPILVAIFVLAALAALLAASAAAWAGTDRHPVARADSYSMREDGTLHIKAPGVLRNDYDREHHRLFVRRVLGVEYGTLNLSKRGGFTYEPRSNFRGTDYFKYRACERVHPGRCSRAVAVKITVRGVQDDPIARPDSYDARKNHAKRVKVPGVLRNDSHPDGNALKVISYKQPRHGAVTMGSHGSFRFRPDRNFTGKMTFRYWIGDGYGGRDSAVVTMKVRR